MVLAGGDATAMRGTRPKPLHRLCGRPMVSFVLDAVRSQSVDRVVVVVDGEADRVAKAIGQTVEGLAPDIVDQPPGAGSGDAVTAGLSAFASDELDDDDADVLIVFGDAPLLRTATLTALVEHHRISGADATFLAVPVGPEPGALRAHRGRDGRITEVSADPVEPGSIDDGVQVTDVLCIRRSLVGPALRRVADGGTVRGYEVLGLVPVLHQAGYRIELAALRRVADGCRRPARPERARCGNRPGGGRARARAPRNPATSRRRR
ncbi:MAG: NTP transferase domain-containing protein, partial [Actinomycetota bacterium]